MTTGDAPPDPTRTEIDGVPVFWSSCSGPLRAGLLFRVGRVDERLPQSGISHLVEHLALSTVGPQPFDYNGMVSLTHTMFVATGTADELVGFFRSVCESLQHPPVSRLEVEKRVLRTEASGRGASAFGSLLANRFGPQRYGIPGYDEFALDTADADQLTAWAREFYTSGNAALWISGEPPPGLRLPLPPGARVPTPPVTSPIRMTLPAWYSDRIPGIAMSMLAPRSTGANLLCSLLGERLQQRLRHERGISYTVSTDYERLDARTAHLMVYADALAEAAPEVRDVVLETTESLTREPVPTVDIDRLRAHRLREIDDPDMAVGQCVSWAADELFGGAQLTREELRAELHSITPASLQEVASGALRTALIVVPPDVTVTAAPYEPVPRMPANERVHGRVLRDKTGGQRRLVFSDRAVSVVYKDRSHTTLRFADVVATLAWDDGSRMLIDEEGFVLPLDVQEWRSVGGGSERIAAVVDAQVPADRHIPSGAAPYRENTQRSLPDRYPTAAAWLTGVAAAFLALIAVLALYGGFGPPSDTSTDPDAGTNAIIQTFVLLSLSGWLALRCLECRAVSRRGTRPTD